MDTQSLANAVFSATAGVVVKFLVIFYIGVASGLGVERVTATIVFIAFAAALTHLASGKKATASATFIALAAILIAFGATNPPIGWYGIIFALPAVWAMPRSQGILAGFIILEVVIEALAIFGMIVLFPVHEYWSGTCGLAGLLVMFAFWRVLIHFKGAEFGPTIEV